MIKISRKRLKQNVVHDLLCTLDPLFAKRLEETVNIGDYSLKLAEHANFEVADISGEWGGVIAFYENEKELYIPYVCVSQSRRRMGVAGLLMDSVCGYADSKGKPVSLEVRTSNVGAIKLYEKYGFEIKGDDGTKYHMTRMAATSLGQ